jgi:hypothetical protein
MTITVSSKDLKCRYDVQNYHENGSTHLGMDVFRDTFSARITTFVKKDESDDRRCTRYDFFEIKVNDSILTSRDVREAKNLVALFNSRADTQLTVDASHIKNGDPQTYTQVSMDLDGDGYQTRTIQRVDRTYVDIKNFQEYRDLSARIQK